MKLHRPGVERVPRVRATEILSSSEVEPAEFSLDHFFESGQWQEIEKRVVAHLKERESSPIEKLDDFLYDMMALQFLDHKKAEHIKSDKKVQRLIHKLIQDAKPWEDYGGYGPEPWQFPDPWAKYVPAIARWLFPDLVAEFPELEESWKVLISKAMAGDVKAAVFAVLCDPQSANTFDPAWVQSAHDLAMQTVEGGIFSDGDMTIPCLMAVSIYKEKLSDRTKIVQLAKLWQKGDPRHLGQWDDERDDFLTAAFVRLALAKDIEITPRGYIIHDQKPTLGITQPLPDRSTL